MLNEKAHPDFVYDSEAEPNMRAALTPSPVDELVERLGKVAGPVRMNNGSFSDLAHEAAASLTSLSAENARLRGQLDTPLICDVQIPGTTFRRGVSTETLLKAIERRSEWAEEDRVLGTTQKGMERILKEQSERDIPFAPKGGEHE